jgi:hypothetical protein
VATSAVVALRFKWWGCRRAAAALLAMGAGSEQDRASLQLGPAQPDVCITSCTLCAMVLGTSAAVLLASAEPIAAQATALAFVAQTGLSE